jgi:hypothetical protein
MDEEHQERLAAWIKEKWKYGACQLCKETAWETAELVDLPASADAGQEAGSLYPVLMFICGNCGHTIFVNALRAGILLIEEEGIASETEADA